MFNALLTLYHVAAYSLSVTLLVSVATESGRKKNAACFLLTAASCTIVFQNKSLLPLLPLVTVLVTVLLFRKGKPIQQVLFQCFSVVFLLWLMTASFSSLVMLLVPRWHESTGFRIAADFCMVLFSMYVRWQSTVFRGWLQLQSGAGYVAAIECIILIFFSVILPACYPAIQDKRRFSVFSLSLLFLLSVVGMLFHHFKKLEQETKAKLLHQEHQDQYGAQIQKQLDTIMELKHYYNNLYASLCPCIRDRDMENTAAIFQRTIMPIHNRYIQDTEPLSQIENTLLRNLLDVTLERVGTTMPDTALTYSITGKVKLPDVLELDVFEITSIFLDNAVKELQRQESGLLWLKVSGYPGQAIIQITNTLTHAIEMWRLFEKPKGGHGYGLNQVQKIISNHPPMEHHVFHWGDGKQNYITQKLIIHTEMEGRNCIVS